jgi:hypothetical protein
MKEVHGEGGSALPVRGYAEFGGIRAEYRLHLAGTFCEKAAAYMKHYHWYTDDFQARTGLSNDIYSKIQTGKLKRPIKRIVVSVCVGLALDYRMATDLLHCAGCSLVLNDPLDAAYDYILSDMRGDTIDACNIFLEEQGLPPLGTQERNTDRIGKVAIA